MHARFRTRGHPPRGFTIVELLVVIAIVGILVAISTGIMMNAGKSGDRVAAVQQLRQIGLGIQTYTTDNDGTLPGPLWPGQMPIYDPDRAGRLAGELAPYFDLDADAGVQLVREMVPPAFRREMEVSIEAQPRTFVANLVWEVNDITYTPLGDARDDSPPMKAAALPPNANNFWILSDADQQHPEVGSAPWSGNTPAEPVHGNQRATLYLDGRAAMQPLEYFEPDGEDQENP